MYKNYVLMLSKTALLLLISDVNLTLVLLLFVPFVTNLQKIIEKLDSVFQNN